MNLPNKLTMLRLVMIPLFLVCLFLLSAPWNYLLALVLFIAASLTDLLDGRIARSRGLVTDFGKLMDPLADKLLVSAALICGHFYTGQGISGDGNPSDCRKQGNGSRRRQMGKAQNRQSDDLDLLLPAWVLFGQRL